MTRTAYIVIEEITLRSSWAVAIEGNEDDAIAYALSSESPLPECTKSVRYTVTSQTHEGG